MLPSSNRDFTYLWAIFRYKLFWLPQLAHCFHLCSAAPAWPVHMLSPFEIISSLIDRRKIIVGDKRWVFITKAKFYLVNPSNPSKIEKNSGAYYARTRDKSGSNSPPFQRNVQIPHSPGMMHSQMPGICPGGMLKFRIDRRITLTIWKQPKSNC